MSTTHPIPVSEATKVLIALGLEKMQGVGHPKFEIWVAEDGRPEMIPYADPQGQFFDGESLQEIYKRNG